MLIETIKRQLEYGGYQRVQAPGFPCDIMIKKKEVMYAVCLIENTDVLRTQGIQIEYLQSAVKVAVEKKFFVSCKTIVLLISDNISRDKVFTDGCEPVWLIDRNGRRIVFENQPGQFGDVEMLLERSPKRWDKSIFKKGTVPWVTFVLVVINLIVQIVVAAQIQLTGESDLLEKMVLHIGIFQIKPQYYRLVTSAFLHFGWVHLLNNMMVLMFLGKIAERITGKVWFIVSYLVCAVGANAASIIWYTWNGEMNVSTAGASGAVFAVAGMILAWMILGRGRLETVSLRQVILMMVFTTYHGITEGGVNNCAHIAGAVMGVVFGILIWTISALRQKKFRQGQEMKV